MAADEGLPLLLLPLPLPAPVAVIDGDVGEVVGETATGRTTSEAAEAAEAEGTAAASDGAPAKPSETRAVATGRASGSLLKLQERR
jgi:hypothetical protein